MYIEKSLIAMRHSLTSAREQIIVMADAVAKIMADHGVMQVFGVNQDEAFGMELGYRAGGLVQYHRLSLKDLVMKGVVDGAAFEHPDFLYRPEIAQKLWDIHAIDARDGLIIYAPEAVYPCTLALAQLAKKKGHPVLVVYNHNALAGNEHSARIQALLALSDAAIDLHVAYPDLIGDLEGYRYGQVTNLIGNMVAQSLTMEIYQIFSKAGQPVPVLWSANIKGADEYNKSITAPFDGRWNS